MSTLCRTCRKIVKKKSSLDEWEGRTAATRQRLSHCLTDKGEGGELRRQEVKVVGLVRRCLEQVVESVQRRGKNGKKGLVERTVSARRGHQAWRISSMDGVGRRASSLAWAKMLQLT